MANMRDIRRRIRSVTNIQQITKAMKMVASARLQKAQSKAQGAMPFTTRLKEILGNLAGSEINYVHPLMVKPEKPTGKVAYLLITSDKGLAGAYSSNVIKELLPYVKDNPNADIFAVGRKGYEYFTRRNYSIKEKYLGFSERPSVDDARRITRDMSELFLSGTYDEIHIVSYDNRFDREDLKKSAEGIKECLLQNGYIVDKVDVPMPGKHPHGDQLKSLLFLLQTFAVI